jgi:hypothetical protein
MGVLALIVILSYSDTLQPSPALQHHRTPRTLLQWSVDVWEEPTDSPREIGSHPHSEALRTAAASDGLRQGK